MTTREPRTITLTATQMRRQLAGLVDQIRDHGLRVIVTRRGVPIGALVPLEFRPGRGVTIARRGKPVAKVVGLKLLTAAA
jgi:prevent-host-death family protein